MAAPIVDSCSSEADIAHPGLIYVTEHLTSIVTYNTVVKKVLHHVRIDRNGLNGMICKRRDSAPVLARYYGSIALRRVKSAF